MSRLGYCKDCEILVPFAKKRCTNCQTLFRNHTRKHLQNKVCAICQAPIRDTAKHCKTHAQPLGKDSPHFKHGLYINGTTSKLHHYQTNTHCVECETLISDGAIRCRTCEIKRITLSKQEKLKRRNIREKLKKRADIEYRLVSILRSTISGAVGQNIKRKRTKELVGCTVEELKSYLENHFQPGMSWDTYGPKGWHIDHIIPCVAFDLTNEQEQHRCFHYTNLQPLWWYENLKKGATINV